MAGEGEGERNLLNLEFSPFFFPSFSLYFLSILKGARQRGRERERKKEERRIWRKSQRDQEERKISCPATFLKGIKSIKREE